MLQRSFWRCRVCTFSATLWMSIFFASSRPWSTGWWWPASMEFHTTATCDCAGDWLGFLAAKLQSGRSVSRTFAVQGRLPRKQSVTDGSARTLVVRSCCTCRGHRWPWACSWRKSRRLLCLWLIKRLSPQHPEGYLNSVLYIRRRCYAEAKRKLGARYTSVGSVVDVAAGQHSMCSSPTMLTIAASRGKGHNYYTCRRKISTVELGRLQGGVIHVGIAATLF